MTSARLRSSAVMAAGTIVSRILGFARTAVVAAALGAALTADTFTVANTVPNTIYILVAGGVLNAVLVPQLVRAMKEGEAAGQAYSDRLLTLAGLALGALTLVVTVAAPLVMQLYAGQLAASDTAVAVAFAYWCLPQVFFYGLYTLLGQVLNARDSFGPMMWAPVVNNIVAIVTGVAFLLLFEVDPDRPGSLSTGEIAFFGAGTTLGVVLQALVLLPVLRRTGFRYRPRFDFRGVGLGHTGDLAKWTLAFVLVNQVAYAVIVNLTSAIAAAGKDQLDHGAGLFVYSSAYLIFILPHSIITVSLVTSALPQLSRDAADGDLRAVRATLSETWRLAGVGIVLAAAGYLALAPDLTGVLFSGGEVDPEGARYIGWVTMAFAVALPLFSAQYVALRGFYAFEDTRTPFLLQVGIATTNVVVALVAYAVLPLRWRLIGIALAYGAAYLVGLLVSTRVLARRTGGLDGRRVVRTYVRLVVAAAPAAALGWLTSYAVGERLGNDPAGSLAALLAGGPVVLAGFLLGARLLHIGEVYALLSVARRRGRSGDQPSRDEADRPT
jgi:putative peptidoglycan lipid II flippase